MPRLITPPDMVMSTSCSRHNAETGPSQNHNYTSLSLINILLRGSLVWFRVFPYSFPIQFSLKVFLFFPNIKSRLYLLRQLLVVLTRVHRQNSSLFRHLLMRRHLLLLRRRPLLRRPYHHLVRPSPSGLRLHRLELMRMLPDALCKQREGVTYHGHHIEGYTDYVDHF